MNTEEFLAQFNQLGFEYNEYTGGSIEPEVSKIKTNGYVLVK